MATTLQDKIFTGFKIEIKCKDCHVQWKITIFSQEALDEPNIKKRTKFFLINEKTKYSVYKLQFLKTKF